jgi:phosphoribosylaminoimidazole-succinocarboxamide synthase
MNISSRPEIAVTGVTIEGGCLMDMQVSGSGHRDGKVRKVINLGDEVLLLATDRISAFDVILPTGIPDKGRVLNGMSEFWFNMTKGIVPNGMITTDMNEIGKRIRLGEFGPMLAGRSMLMRKGKTLKIECIVRGYITGSGWKDYLRSKAICGIGLPDGLIESCEFKLPLFTPSTKAEFGHDENISFDQACNIVGTEIAYQVREHSLSLYKFARDYARTRGIIIADTKFEFAVIDGKLFLVDEALTPDSSRFWPADTYKPGGPQPSYDKQHVRDYLETLCKAKQWDKTVNNIPVLPPNVVVGTAEKYLEAFQRLTGKELMQ